MRVKKDLYNWLEITNEVIHIENGKTSVVHVRNDEPEVDGIKTDSGGSMDEEEKEVLKNTLNMS